MTNEERTKLLKIIIAMSAYYGQPKPDDTLKMYVDDLAQFSFEVVTQALKSYRRNPANTKMFIPAQIIEIINPTLGNKDLAKVTAARVREAVGKFGWPNPDAAATFIGPAGWRAVLRFGGWQHVCENLGRSISETTFQAQVRDIIEADLNAQNAGYDTNQPLIEQTKEPAQIGAIIRQALGGREEETK